MKLGFVRAPLLLSCSLVFVSGAGCEGAVPVEPDSVALRSSALQVAPQAIPLARTVQARGLRASDGTALCLDVNGGTAANGTALILYPCHGATNQQFTFNRATGEIRSGLGGFCVDVDHQGAFAGNRVQLWTCNQTAAQRFTYDSASGAVRYAAAPSLCADAASGSLALASCSGAASQAFDLHARYGDRRFNELTALTTHNSYSNSSEATWIAPNQATSITQQLNDGVRGLMLDVFSFQSSTTRCIATLGQDCYGQDLYMCHGDCNGVPGVGFGFPRQTVASGFAQVVSFLSANPDELVTVFLEDYSAHDELATVLSNVPGLRPLMFDPYAWNVIGNGWPKADDLIAANQRLLIISDHWGKQDLGVGYGPELTVENYWSIGELGDKYDCYSRWSSIPLNQQDPHFERLFVMNHFRDVPVAQLSAVDNSYANLTDRLDDYCVPASGKKPNYIAVDYYDRGDGARLAQEVDRSSVILFYDANFSGRAQLIGPGTYNVGDLTVGNDAISSIAIAPETQVTVYSDASLLGNSKTFTSSASYVGDDFNDRASSLVVTFDGP
jgi:hypothetical protein